MVDLASVAWLRLWTALRFWAVGIVILIYCLPKPGTQVSDGLVLARYFKEQMLGRQHVLGYEIALLGNMEG